MGAPQRKPARPQFVMHEILPGIKNRQHVRHGGILDFDISWQYLASRQLLRQQIDRCEHFAPKNRAVKYDHDDSGENRDRHDIMI